MWMKHWRPAESCTFWIWVEDWCDSLHITATHGWGENKWKYTKLTTCLLKSQTFNSQYFIRQTKLNNNNQCCNNPLSLQASLQFKLIFNITKHKEENGSNSSPTFKLHEQHDHSRKKKVKTGNGTGTHIVGAQWITKDSSREMIQCCTPGHFLPPHIQALMPCVVSATLI